MQELPLVSIILPIYNDEDTLNECIQTLVGQDYPKKEIIVVDDGSTDRTPKMLAQLAEEQTDIKVFRIKHTGVTVARNFGFKKSKGEIIFYAEGDSIYNEDYVSKAISKLMKDDKVGGVCVTGGLWAPTETVVSKYIDVENRIKRKMLELGRRKPYYAWIFKREALEKVEGFDETLFQGEDRDVFLRVKESGYSIGLVTGINWRHKRDQDLWSYMKRAYVGGKSRILFIIKHRRIIEFLRNVVLLWFFIICVMVAPFNTWALYSVVLLLASYFSIKLGLLVYRGWDCVSRKRHLLLLPFFSLLRYVVIGIGLTFGLIVLIGRKIGRSHKNGSPQHSGA